MGGREQEAEELDLRKQQYCFLPGPTGQRKRDKSSVLVLGGDRMIGKRGIWKREKGRGIRGEDIPER
jgi:hypothetical protein